MIPLKLQLKHFMSYRQPEALDFTGFDLAVMSGNNGAGKSSILEAITWAVWGKSRAASDDNLVHQGTAQMWVEYIFEYEGNRYRILRTRELRGRGSTSLEFQVATKDYGMGSLAGTLDHWKSLTGPTIKQTQDLIARTLKLDYELFVNSSYLRQGHADEFTTKTPAERKGILSQILDLSLYDQLEAKAKEKQKEAQLKSDLLQAQLADLSARVQPKESVEKELLSLQKEMDQRQQSLVHKEALLKSLEADRRMFESLKREVVLMRERFEETSRELQDLRAEQDEELAARQKAEAVWGQKAEIEEKYRSYEKLKMEYDQMQLRFRDASAIDQELRLIAHREEELKATIARLSHVTICPTCLRKMSKKEAELIIKSLTTQFEKEVLPRKKDLEKKRQATGFDNARLEQIRESLVELEGIDRQKRTLDLAQITIEKSTKRLGSIAKKIGQIMEVRLDIEKRGKEVSSQLTRMKDKQVEWEKLEAEVTLLRKEREALQEKQGGLKDRLSQIASLEGEIGQKERELKEQTESVFLYGELATSFGKKGIQAMIIEQTVPQIEEGANFLLQKISGGRMQVKFVTQRAKKSGENELIETLDIEIHDELGLRPYEQYSGGEAFRINFAVRVALAKLLAMRAGSKLRFLVVDEGFGALDASGKEDIVAAISGIREEFSKIIIVSHIEEFKNLFPTRIEVTKDNNGSHIQVISQ